MSPESSHHRWQWRRRLLRTTLLGITMMIVVLGVLLQQISSRTGAPATLSALQSGGTSTARVPQVGDPAPNFTLKTLDGREVALADFKGQPVLINFWASWCPPCRAEMPDLVRAYESNKTQDFTILGIDLTFQDSLPDVQAFVKEFNMTFPVLLDETGDVAQNRYGIRGIPYSVFVDRNGRISAVRIGAMSPATINRFVADIVQRRP